MPENMSSVSSEQRKWAALTDDEGATLPIVKLGSMIDSHGLVNCGVKIGRAAGIAGGQGCVLVAAAINLPSANTATCEGDGVDGGVMVSPSFAIDLWGPAEFGEKDNKSLVELAPLLEVGKKSGGRLVEHGEQPLFHLGEVIVVSIEGVGIPAL